MGFFFLVARRWRRGCFREAHSFQDGENLHGPVSNEAGTAGNRSPGFIV